jgi:ABC-2 type transport system permease protein
VSDLARSIPTLPGRLPSIADARTMAARWIRLSMRDLDALLTSLMLPVILMLVFVYLFGGAIETGTAYVTYVVPGVILLCAGFGSATTAVTVGHDMTSGIIDRLRSMDVGGAAVLAGHVAAGVARNAASTILVFGVAFLIGFRPHAGPLDWLAAVAVLLAFVLAVSWLAAAIGLLLGTPVGTSAWTALAWCGAILGVSVAVSGVLFGRRTA